MCDHVRIKILKRSRIFYIVYVIFYERKYTITWLQWNATSRGVNIVVKLIYIWFDRLRSTKHIKASWSPWKQARFATFGVLMTIGVLFGHVLIVFSISDVSVRELLGRWFSSFQLELARPNYINRNIETFKMYLVMQKALVKFKHRLCKSWIERH